MILFDLGPTPRSGVETGYCTPRRWSADSQPSLPGIDSQVTLQLSTSSTVEELLNSTREALGGSSRARGRLLFRMRPLKDLEADLWSGTAWGEERAREERSFGTG